MMKDIVGQKYHSYYYAISDVIIANPSAITLSNFTNHFNFANDVINASDIIVNGPNTAIPFTTSFKSTALGFISDYRTIDTSAYFNNILDDIEDDLGLILG